MRSSCRVSRAPSRGPQQLRTKRQGEQRADGRAPRPGRAAARRRLQEHEQHDGVGRAQWLTENAEQRHAPDDGSTHLPAARPGSESTARRAAGEHAGQASTVRTSERDGPPRSRPSAPADRDDRHARRSGQQPGRGAPAGVADARARATRPTAAEQRADRRVADGDAARDDEALGRRRRRRARTSIAAAPPRRRARSAASSRTCEPIAADRGVGSSQEAEQATATGTAEQQSGRSPEAAGRVGADAQGTSRSAWPRARSTPAIAPNARHGRGRAAGSRAARRQDQRAAGEGRDASTASSARGDPTRRDRRGSDGAGRRTTSELTRPSRRWTGRDSGRAVALTGTPDQARQERRRRRRRPAP